MTDTTRDYLPGMYRNFRPNPDESFPGYILRLAEGNGFSGIRDVLNSALASTVSKPLASIIREFRGSKEALRELGRMAFGEVDGLTHYFAQRLAADVDGGDKATHIGGRLIDNDALMYEFSQVCSQCLAERGVALEAWDFAPIVGCTTHKTILLSTCPTCGQRVTWSRSQLMYCEGCGADYRAVQCPPLPDTWVDMTLDFEALAPFRFFLRDGGPLVSSWDTAFRLLKLLSLNQECWCNGQWPATVPVFSGLPVEVRSGALESFAMARVRDGYALQRLQPYLERKVEHLRGIPLPNVCEEAIYRLAYRGAGLFPEEFSESLAYRSPRSRACTGAELFGGRPPVLRSNDEVASFLGVDSDTSLHLHAVGVLRWPFEAQLGYDIDEVLEAQRLLAGGLLSVQQIRQLIGVPIDWEEFSRNPLLRSWHPAAAEDHRVRVDEAIALQHRIRLAVSSLPEPLNAVELKVFAALNVRPLTYVLAGIQRLLNGGFRAAAWGPQYDWASLQVERVEAAALDDELTESSRAIPPLFASDDARSSRRKATGS